MKTLFFVFIALFFAGCAGTMPPEKADLNIDVPGQSGGVYPASLAIAINGQDKRSDPHIIVYRTDDPPTALTSRVPPENLLQESLAHGFRQQGLARSERSTITASIVVKELVVKVTRAGAMYAAKANTRLQFIVNNNGSILTLEYSRESTKDTIGRPKLLDLEIMLNEQLNDIATKILADDRVRTAINKKS